MRDRGGFKTLYEALWDHQRFTDPEHFTKKALFQKSNGVNSRFYLSTLDVEEISHFRVISKWTPRSDANTETAGQIRHLISFPVPLELRLGEGIISSKFFLQQLRCNFFLFNPIFSLFYEDRQETSFLILPEGEKLREKINWRLH